MSSPGERSGVAWIAAVLATMALVGMTFGATSPLVSALLEERGASEYFTASVTVALAIAVIFASPLAGKWVARVGVRRVQAIGIVGQALGFVAVGLALDHEYRALPGVRFIIGVFGSMCWVATEVALLAGVRAGVRGRVMALYGISMTDGFAVGVFVSSRLYDALGTQVFAAIAVFSIVPLVLGLVALRGHEIGSDDSGKPGQAPPWGPIALAIAGSALFGFAETAMGSQFPVEGQRLGLSRTAAVDLVGFVVLGEVLIQLPAGWLADRRGAPFVLGVCAALGIAGAALAAFAARGPLGGALHASALFAIGASFGAAYPSSLKLLAERVTPDQLPVANGRFAAFFGVGALGGPLLAALLVDLAGRADLLGFALPTVTAVGFLALAPLIYADRAFR